VTLVNTNSIAMDPSIRQGAADGANSERTIVIGGTGSRETMQDAKA
jgi:hypothetical protein